MKYSGILKISKIEENELKTKLFSVQTRLDLLNADINFHLKSIKDCEHIVNNTDDILITMSSLNHISSLERQLNLLFNKRDSIMEELSEVNVEFIDKKSERKGIENLVLKYKHEKIRLQERKEQLFLDELNSK